MVVKLASYLVESTADQKVPQKVALKVDETADPKAVLMVAWMAALMADQKVPQMVALKASLWAGSLAG